MRTLLIVNPKAGSGRAAARWPGIRTQAEAALGAFSHSFTERQGHAIEIARQAASDGVERIIAVGGDGTANEVTNGLMAAMANGGPAPVLGVIPCGTGSDFCRSLGLKPDPAAALARMASGAMRTIDIGHAHFTDKAGAVSQRHFLNIATFGLSGTISANINNRDRGALLPGPVRYLAGTLSALAGYRPPRMRITVDGTVLERDVHLAAVANACYFGGGMRIAPRASLDDGLFDVVVLDAIPRLRLARKIAKVYSGRHLDEPEITFLKGRHVTAETVLPGQSAMGMLDLDGENPGMLGAEFRILDKALRLGM